MKKELWERVPTVIKKGGGVYRKKRKTKRGLVEEYYKKEEKMSPEIGTVVKEGADDVNLNVPYEIVNVESDVKTDVQLLSGVRVELLSVKGDVGNIMLWKRPVTGPKSKLGAFIVLLGSNTDKWLHKWIIIRSIGARNNVIELTSPPVEKATKAQTAEGISKAIDKGGG